jgi:acyl dehydratase
MATEVTLDAVPSLGRLYSQALGRSATLALARPVGDARLPDVVYRADGVRADPAQLAEYQHLLGEPGTDVLPAGYVHVLAFPVAVALMARADFPLPLLGLVHVANEVEVHRPVHLAEELTVRARAEGLRPHRAGTQVDLVVEVSTDGEPLWRGTSAYLARGRREAGPAPGPAPVDDAARDAGSESPDAAVAPTAVWRLGADVGRRYAAVSGDRNPIHTSRVGARMFGFRRPVAHGMYTAARALAAVGPARGEAFTWEVTFAKPVLLPGTVSLAVERADGGFRYTGVGPGGAVHLTGRVLPTGPTTP